MPDGLRPHPKRDLRLLPQHLHLFVVLWLPIWRCSVHDLQLPRQHHRRDRAWRGHQVTDDLARRLEAALERERTHLQQSERLAKLLTAERVRVQQLQYELAEARGLLAMTGDDGK